MSSLILGKGVFTMDKDKIEALIEEKTIELTQLKRDIIELEDELNGG